MHDWIISRMPKNKASSPGHSINNNPPRTKAIMTGATVDRKDRRLALIGESSMISVLLWSNLSPAYLNLNVLPPVRSGDPTTWVHERCV